MTNEFDYEAKIASVLAVAMAGICRAVLVARLIENAGREKAVRFARG